MNIIQAILIAIFIYLASIGSIVGNTIGWYSLGRPIVASLVVGIIMGNVPLAIQLGLLLQLANLGSVTPGGAVGWDLSYATYIGVAGALAFDTGDLATTTAVMWTFSVVGGAIGVAMWNVNYALNLFTNRISYQGALEANPKKIAFANAGLGNIIGFLTRFIPAMILLSTTAVVGSQSGINVAEIIPAWFLITINTFGGMMAALGMGILLSFLIKEKWQWALVVFGFMLVGYLKLSMMACAMFAIIIAIVYYVLMERVSYMSKKVSKSTLRKSWKTWFFWHGCSQQGENLLGNAMAHTMSPVIEELYTTKEDKVEAYKRSLTLFNTEQQLGAIAPGILIGVEESVANKEITPDVAESIKVALIGPTSAIGDSLWVATIIPLLLTITMTITNIGNVFLYLGPLLYAVGYPVLTSIMSWRLWNVGYSTGIGFMKKFMKSGKLELITKTMTILGLIVVGALIASFVSLSIPLAITPPGGETAAVNVDDMINAIFPNLLPLLLTIGVYRLYAKKKKSPLFIMGFILVIAILLTIIGKLSGIYTF